MRALVRSALILAVALLGVRVIAQQPPAGTTFTSIVKRPSWVVPLTKPPATAR